MVPGANAGVAPSDKPVEPRPLAEYAKASGFGTVAQSIGRTQRALQQVEERVGEGFTTVSTDDPTTTSDDSQ